MAEEHQGLQKKAEEVEAHNQEVVGEVEVLHLGEVVAVVVVEYQHVLGEEEEVEEDSLRVEVGEEEVEEEVELQHPLVGVVEVVLLAQLDLLRSASIRQKC